MKHILTQFLPLALVTTVLSGTIYVTVQQNYRLSANDPQIQLAEDTASALAHDQQVTLPQPTIEISESLSPYIIVYDEAGKQVLTNATLHAKAPSLPSGVFQNAKNQIESRFTWQPEVGVREAVVLRYVGQKGYVLAGRSLREVEDREEKLLGLVFFGWITSLFGSLITITLLSFFNFKKN